MTNCSDKSKTPARHSALSMAICSALFVMQAQAATVAGTPDMTVTADDNPETGYTSSQSSVASKMPTARLDEALSISTVTQQQLEDYQASSLADAMRFVSGVTEANTLAGTEDGFVRRGFGSNADGSSYRDGIRSSQGLNFDATTERVEVLKGSASLLYGIQNPGGVINVVSKKPQYSWHTKVSGRYASEGGGAGTLDVTG
ncbi:MAG: TonB-dependent receptor plug domain-containing protein, partial [Pantoea sp.]|nr:TonB-dependent receptor plug domain-containing protein [Pantoea sp.]